MINNETKITAKILFTCKVALEENLADKKLLKGIIKETLRKYGDTKSMRVSKAAQEKYPTRDLTTCRNNLKDKKIDGLFYEHKDTVSEVTKQILESNSIEEIESILDKSEVAWVTLMENFRLSKNGFNSKRPDSDLAYKVCGIELL